MYGVCGINILQTTVWGKVYLKQFVALHTLSTGTQPVSGVALYHVDTDYYIYLNPCICQTVLLLCNRSGVFVGKDF